MALADTLNRRTLGSLHEDPAAPRKHIDVGLLVVTGLISLIGLALIYSARHRRLTDAGLDPFYYVKRQSLALIVGGIALVVIASIDYRKYREWAGYFFVASSAVLLLVVSPLGSRSKGAQAWFQLGSFQLQPSEFAKITLIVALAAVAASANGHLDRRRLGIALAHRAHPRRPDHAAARPRARALVIAAITMGMLLVAGAKPRHIVVLTLLGLHRRRGDPADRHAEAVPARPPHGVPRPGPARRRTSRPVEDRHRCRRRDGAGLFKGTQTNLAYVPEQHTDFIFTVVGEELGFVGAATLLVLYAVARRGASGARRSCRRDLFGTLVCVGVLAMFVFQIFENVGMTMGIMPVTGIPLPLHVLRRLVDDRHASPPSAWSLNVHMRRFICRRHRCARRLRSLRSTIGASRAEPAHCPLQRPPPPLGWPHMSSTLAAGSNRSWPGCRSRLATSVCEDGSPDARSRPRARSAWLLVYPDTYEIGLPNQGLQILYEILNERADARGRARLRALDRPRGAAARRTGCRCSRSTPTARPATSTSRVQPVGRARLHERARTASTSPACRCAPRTAGPSTRSSSPAATARTTPSRWPTSSTSFVIGDGEEVVGEITEVVRRVEGAAVATRLARARAARARHDPGRLRAVDVRRRRTTARASSRSRPRYPDVPDAGREAHGRRPRRLAVPEAASSCRSPRSCTTA